MSSSRDRDLDRDRDRRLRPGLRDSSDATQPLQGLRLASHAVLEEAQQRGRSKCAKCGGSRMFFCYTCCSLVGVGLREIPEIRLPFKIDIIKHPNETDGKSTAIHAKILAPSDVTIYTYPCIPPFDRDKVALVFPGPAAVSMEDMLQVLSDRAAARRSRDRSSEPCPKRSKVEEAGDGAGAEQRASPLQRVVFIDSTWNQTNKISTDERLQDLVQVELKSRTTCFWRRQRGKPDTYLATIEAIYYFLKDFHLLRVSERYDGQYDNMLFFYSFLHGVVHRAHSSKDTHSNNTDTHSNNTDTHSNNTDTHSTNNNTNNTSTDTDSNNTDTHSTDTDTHSNNTHSNNTDTHSNNTDTHSNNTDTHSTNNNTDTDKTNNTNTSSKDTHSTNNNNTDTHSTNNNNTDTHNTNNTNTDTHSTDTHNTDTA